MRERTIQTNVSPIDLVDSFDISRMQTNSATIHLVDSFDPPGRVGDTVDISRPDKPIPAQLPPHRGHRAAVLSHPPGTHSPPPELGQVLAVDGSHHRHSVTRPPVACLAHSSTGGRDVAQILIQS
jgi:hypothetical protein